MEPNVHPRDTQSFDASDPNQVRQRDLAAKRREKSDREVLVSLLASPDGRAWMWDTLAACHIYELSFDPDAHVAAFREGERNIGLRLIQQINRCAPGAMLEMMKERADG